MARDRALPTNGAAPRSPHEYDADPFVTVLTHMCWGSAFSHCGSLVQLGEHLLSQRLTYMCWGIKGLRL